MIISICFTVSCPALNLMNGHVTYDSDSVGNDRYPVNTRATFTCNVGHRLDGPLGRDCQPSGDWDQETATCTYGNEAKCLLLQDCNWSKNTYYPICDLANCFLVCTATISKIFLKKTFPSK